MSDGADISEQDEAAEQAERQRDQAIRDLLNSLAQRSDVQIVRFVRLAAQAKQCERYLFAKQFSVAEELGISKQRANEICNEALRTISSICSRDS